MTDIGGGWYLKKCARGLPPLNRTKLSKKAQDRHDIIKKKYESNRWWNYWRFQLHWNKLEWVDCKSTTNRVMAYSVSSKRFYIINNDRTAHFIGHSKLKELDIDDFYKRKQMNEEMEAEITKMDSIPDHLADSEYEGADEAVPINIRKEGNKKAYK